MKKETANKTVRSSKPDASVNKGAKPQNKIEFDSENPALLPIGIGSSSFSSVGGFSYVPFLGVTDNLFRILLELRLTSPTQGNCINDKVFYSIGTGLQVQSQEFPTDFDRKINHKGQTIDDVIKAIFESFYQDGNKFIEIVRQTYLGAKYISVYPHNNMDCRLEENEDGSDPTHVIRSREFRRDGIFLYTDKNKPVRIPLWTDDPVRKLNAWVADPKDPSVERTMIHIRNEVQGIDGYGLPSNYAGARNAWLELSVAQFNIDNFDNNLFLSGLLLLQGSHSGEEEKEITDKILQMYSRKNGGKARRIMAISSESGVDASKFIPLKEKEEGHFIEFDKHNEDKIISANNWSKDLLDLKDSASMGKGGSFLSTLFKMKFKTVIRPAQEIVVNNFVFPLMKIIDEWKGSNFYALPWQINPIIPVSLEGSLDVNAILTVDEGRDEIGRSPLEGDQGKRLIKEVVPPKQNNGGPDQ